MTARYFCIFIFALSCVFASCKKSIQIQPPVGTIVASNVFANDPQAASAAVAMYSEMINANGLGFANSAMSVFAGMSADELISFDQNYADSYVQFQLNNIQVTNSLVYGTFWTNAFSVIYQANSILEGLAAPNGVSDSVKNELIGEAEFVRAFCDFYLVNVFGDIPLVINTNYRTNGSMVRASTQLVYQQIIGDLNDAKLRLAPDYSVGLGQRIIPNKWAAEALMARVYLFMGNWSSALSYSDSVISNTSLYNLVSDPNAIFLANSNEAIWQLQQSNELSPYFNITTEGALLIPNVLNSNYSPPFAYFTSELLNAFEPGDLRKTAWVDSTLYYNTTYYFPYKYKQGPAAISEGAPCLEYYMVLRLAEQILIRAEAQAHLNKASAINDLNFVRARAGLPAYGGSTNQDSVLAAIMHERQVELLVEWGSRWLDLKRTNNATTVLSEEKGFQVGPNALLFPIPSAELTVAPNLTQNPGY